MIWRAGRSKIRISYKKLLVVLQWYQVIFFGHQNILNLDPVLLYIRTRNTEHFFLEEELFLQIIFQRSNMLKNCVFWKDQFVIHI